MITLKLAKNEKDRVESIIFQSLEKVGSPAPNASPQCVPEYNSNRYHLSATRHTIIAFLEEKTEKYNERKKKNLIIAVWFPLTLKREKWQSLYKKVHHKERGIVVGQFEYKFR